MGLDYGKWDSQLWEHDEAYQEGYTSEHELSHFENRECMNEQCPLCEHEQDELFQRQYRVREAHHWIMEAPCWFENGIVTVKFTEDRWKALIEVLKTRIGV